ncbi:hypothetical protein TEA_024112 [Camellia sinensis var. sinensis]|uniref:Uncharacterized protein n=1 Tax=Camellia sinensis var. sinensis TaxID=542762 RepID=A0A4S4DZ23_CAMSN|nr:hypothetical protein TEA_024112 [Camellia sinensis var. sinensis]
MENLASSVKLQEREVHVHHDYGDLRQDVINKCMRRLYSLEGMDLQDPLIVFGLTEKAANRGVYSGRSPLLHRRLRQLLDGPRVKFLLFLCLLCLLVLFASRLDSLMGWNPHYPSFVSSPGSTREACVSTIEGENACLRQLPWPRCLCLVGVEHKTKRLEALPCLVLMHASALPLKTLD